MTGRRRSTRGLLVAGTLLLLPAMALLWPFLTVHSGANVRAAAVAGSFYPRDAKELGAMVDQFLSRAAAPTTEGRVIALVAPHAGYKFSGAVAAYSYATLKGRKVRRVVVIAPSHFESFPFVSVYDGSAYETPLGKVPVDTAFAAKLAKKNSLIQLSSRGHVPSAEGAEHALEVQLPFLQRTVGDFQLVPIVMGDQSYQASRALGTELAELIQDQQTLIVASSDLSHYHPYEQASALDRQTLQAVGDFDYLTLSKNLQSRTWEACGGGPIVAAMIAAERLGAIKATVLKYANSGDVTGDKSRVVGYGAVAMVREARASKQAADLSLGTSERAELLKLARKSAEAAVTTKKLYPLPEGLPPGILEDRAAFVTIMKDKELRGCVGYTVPMQSLARTVRDVAALAALRDLRFPPVRADELPRLAYEVSVLSPFRRVADIDEIRLGEDGVLIKHGDTEAIMLPQVAPEQHWNRRTLLEQTAIKVGLNANAWRDKDTDIFVFKALVFGEEKVSTGDPLVQEPRNKPLERPPSSPPR